jgi:hypothetical protein
MSGSANATTAHETRRSAAAIVTADFTAFSIGNRFMKVATIEEIRQEAQAGTDGETLLFGGGVEEGGRMVEAGAWGACRGTRAAGAARRHP